MRTMATTRMTVFQGRRLLPQLNGTRRHSFPIVSDAGSNDSSSSSSSSSNRHPTMLSHLHMPKSMSRDHHPCKSPKRQP